MNKETVAKLNEEQMELVAGGQAALESSTVVIKLRSNSANESQISDDCGKKSIIASRTCPASSRCSCSC